MTRSRVAAIGAGVAVAAASVATLLVVTGDREPTEEGSALRAWSLIPPRMPKTLPEAVAKPSPVPADRPAVTLQTEAKVEADKAKAADAARISRAEAIKLARQARTLGATNLTVFSGTDVTGWDTIGTSRLGPVRRAVPTISLGQFAIAPTVANTATPGNLDKAIVRRYIKRNLQKLQYCYEKTLLARPGIKGAMTIRFAIEESGLVTNGTVSGVDGEVATCINGVISKIEFPKPKGVGGVTIGTTFTFRPAAT